ncbi:hypothetical protein LCGC14_1414140 [marine sediment metagenome]|uniref:Uncharacterized protein n=1 Tax=marine sediment metagenome TaxID=412755 RepID=A0A0F9JTQ4_9ZZZZ
MSASLSAFSSSRTSSKSFSKLSGMVRSGVSTASSSGFAGSAETKTLVSVLPASKSSINSCFVFNLLHFNLYLIYSSSILSKLCQLSCLSKKLK